MDSLRDFVMDNFRYVLSGVLLLLVIIMLGCCSAKPSEKKDKTDKKTDTTEETTTPTDVDVAEPVETNVLEQDAHPEVNALMQKYYDAKAAGDIETLKSTLAVSPSDTEIANIQKMSQYIEGYMNLSCYTKKGPADGSYIVYACYNMKFLNVDTMAPSLNMVYVKPHAGGGLIIENGDWDAETETAIGAINAGEDVQNIAAQVQTAYEAALSQDPKLQEIVNYISGATENKAEESTDAPMIEEQPEQEEQPAQDGETVYAKETVNVRDSASENGNRIGQIAKGDSAKRYSDENGWSKISYNGGEAYVKSDYVTANKEELQAAQSNVAPDSGPAHIIETAKMRSGEDLSSSLIETLYQGTAVTIEEKYPSGRAKITYNGTTGFVNTECLGK